VEKRDKEGIKREFRIMTLKADNITKTADTENTGAEKSKLFPTDLGMIVTDFLNQYFDSVMDYGFTAKIEEEFDEIANGKKVWNKMLNEFYEPFHQDVANTLEKAERVKGERLLGEDPESGKPVVARMGRYGPMIQIGKAEDEEKPRFAKLKATQSIETISMADAMELFRLPRNLGMFEGQEVTVNIGRFGPYAQHDKKFYSLKKEMDPYTVELEEIGPLIVEKRTAKDERTIKVFEKEKIQLLRGPYGPYIKQGLRNYKIPKEKQEHVEGLGLDEIKAIIEEVKANPPKRVPRKKKSS
jgi:DNA topoisomerase-1